MTHLDVQTSRSFKQRYFHLDFHVFHVRLVQLHNKASIEVVSELLDIGGREFVVEKDTVCKWVALYYVYEYHASFEGISKLIEVGGNGLCRRKEKMERLHCTLCYTTIH